ncbi:MAG: SurA N-terminal domain-containing protein [Coriobacteriaceae bacterium]|nr:SurA N-terminal domain-containing protein [Coriobacteriaceae bacterium]
MEQGVQQGAAATTPASAQKNNGSRTAAIIFGIIAIVAIIAAVVGFVLYAGARVPADAAGKVDADFITEDEVGTWIGQYRAQYGLEDDADFAQNLLSQGYNVSTFRQNAINQLAMNAVIDAKAHELGITASDEDIQAQLDTAKANYAFNDDDVWAETLESLHITDEGLRKQYETNIFEDGILEAEVPEQEPTDEDIAAFMGEYLAGTTQKHAMRIVFSGDDASERAQECHKKLTAAQKDGKLDKDTFASLAAEYSDEEADYAWSGNSMDDDIMETVDNLDVGEASGIESIEADDAEEIIYVDEDYTFPKAKDGEDYAIPSDIPAGLLQEVRDADAQTLWQTACDNYLANLLGDAKITYYPMPDDAPYNVDMASANSSSADA